MDLSALRNQIKSQRLSLSKSEVISLSKQVENLLFSLDFIREKSNFFIYNSIKNEVFEFSGSSSATMSQKTAYAIDNAIGAMKVKGSTSMESQLIKENQSTLKYHIEF